MTLAVLVSPCFLCALPAIPSVAAATGSIEGTVEDGGSFETVTAVDRKSGRRYQGELESTGEFIISGLPLDSSYDCLFEFERGVRLEGVDLGVPPSDYVEEQPLMDEDVEILSEKITRLSKFEQVVDVLGVQGNIQHAAVLVNKLRTDPFYNSKPGEIVWRAELWRFERPDETWVKVQDELFTTLYRRRMQRSAYDQQSITFDAALGGLTPTSEEPAIDLGNIAAPDPEPGIRLRGAASLQTASKGSE